MNNTKQNHTTSILNIVTVVHMAAVAAVALLVALPGTARADGLILRGGMNLATASTDPELDADNEKMRRGLNGALLVEAGSGPIRLLTGVGYENKGMSATSALADAELRLDYVTIPVLLSLGTVPSANGTWMPRLFVNVGVEPAFLVNSEGTFADFDFDVDEERFNRFDLGLRGEAGLEIPVSPSAGVVLGAGYSRSLTNAAKDDDYEWYSQTIHIFGGIKVGMF